MVDAFDITPCWLYVFNTNFLGEQRVHQRVVNTPPFSLDRARHTQHCGEHKRAEKVLLPLRDGVKNKKNTAQQLVASLSIVLNCLTTNSEHWMRSRYRP